MMTRRLTLTLAVALIGCSNNSQVLQELEQQRAALNSQQQTMAAMSKSLQDMEQRNRQSEAALAAQEAENQKLLQRLSAATQIQQEARRPTFTFEAPDVTLQGPPAPAVSRKSADLILQSVNVFGTKSNGSAWDDSGPPDLKVRVETSGDSFTTTTKHDTESASFGVQTIRVAEGDSLRVTVYDSDVVFDDEIGSYSKQITTDTLRQGTVTWSFGRVYELVLKFEP